MYELRPYNTDTNLITRRTTCTHRVHTPRCTYKVHDGNKNMPDKDDVSAPSPYEDAFGPNKKAKQGTPQITQEENTSEPFLERLHSRVSLGPPSTGQRKPLPGRASLDAPPSLSSAAVPLPPRATRGIRVAVGRASVPQGILGPH